MNKNLASCIKTPDSILRFLDYTILNPRAPVSHVDATGAASFVVLPSRVTEAVNCGTKVCAAIGFPYGANDAGIKLAEAERAYIDGASEIDYVINYGAFLTGDFGPVAAEARLFKRLESNILIKAIIETCFFNEKQLHQVCRLLLADILKTSTGLYDGANEKAVKVMLEYGEVKASGGIRTCEDAQKFINLGCCRIGSSKWLG